MFKHEHTMVKTITIRDIVYEHLISVKKKDESFSELLERLVESSNSTIVLRKMRGSIVWKDKAKMLKELEESRWEEGR